MAYCDIELDVFKNRISHYLAIDGPGGSILLPDGGLRDQHVVETKFLIDAWKVTYHGDRRPSLLERQAVNVTGRIDWRRHDLQDLFVISSSRHPQRATWPDNTSRKRTWWMARRRLLIRHAINDIWDINLGPYWTDTMPITSKSSSTTGVFGMHVPSLTDQIQHLEAMALYETEQRYYVPLIRQDIPLVLLSEESSLSGRSAKDYNERCRSINREFCPRSCLFGTVPGCATLHSQQSCSRPCMPEKKWILCLKQRTESSDGQPPYLQGSSLFAGFLIGPLACVCRILWHPLKGQPWIQGLVRFVQTPQDRQRYLDDYRQGIALDAEHLSNNLSKCSLTKRKLNYFWGKFVQKNK